MTLPRQTKAYAAWSDPRAPFPGRRVPVNSTGFYPLSSTLLKAQLLRVTSYNNGTMVQQWFEVDYPYNRRKLREPSRARVHRKSE